ncbi:putative RNA-directed DNA polymerase from transposon X-element [Trichonephila clavipes]|nr:putative RNA-directed DNA polymerase from transposon X-element [Trichonephila clavipes]
MVIVFRRARVAACTFAAIRGIHPDPEIRIRDIQIPVVPDVRFLGVIFDGWLSFLPHILHLRKRCEKSLNLLKVLSNTSWGADRTSLLGVYQAIVLSRIDYGCVAYGSACNSTLQKLDPVHHMALRICSGAFRTSPVPSGGSPPLGECGFHAPEVPQ